MRSSMPRVSREASAAVAPTPIDILLSRTSAPRHLQMSDKILRLYTNMWARPENRIYIEVAALLCLSDDNFKIQIQDGYGIRKERNLATLGSYSHGRNSIEFFYESARPDLLLHELIHFICYRVFNNHCAPYASHADREGFYRSLSYTLYQIYSFYSDRYNLFSVSINIDQRNGSLIMNTREGVVTDFYRIGLYIYNEIRSAHLRDQDTKLVLACLKSFVPGDDKSVDRQVQSEVIAYYIAETSRYNSQLIRQMFAPFQNYLESVMWQHFRNFVSTHPLRERMSVPAPGEVEDDITRGFGGMSFRDTVHETHDRREHDRREHDRREHDRREHDRREHDRREHDRRESDRRGSDRRGSDRRGHDRRPPGYFGEMGFKGVTPETTTTDIDSGGWVRKVGPIREFRRDGLMGVAQKVNDEKGWSRHIVTSRENGDSRVKSEKTLDGRDWVTQKKASFSGDGDFEGEIVGVAAGRDWVAQEQDSFSGGGFQGKRERVIAGRDWVSQEQAHFSGDGIEEDKEAIIAGRDRVGIERVKVVGPEEVGYSETRTRRRDWVARERSRSGGDKVVSQGSEFEAVSSSFTRGRNWVRTVDERLTLGGSLNRQ